MGTQPETRYARSGDGYLAYQVLGTGPPDLLVVTEIVSHSEKRWEEPRLAGALHRLAGFGRVILFDRRGTGLSDPVPVDRLPVLEDRARDIEAVIAAAGATRPVVAGFSEGGIDAMFLAATRPDLVASLCLYATWPRFFATDDYPAGWEPERFAEVIGPVLGSWGTGAALPVIAPSSAGDARLLSWWAGYERLAASPGIAEAMFRIGLDVDVRAVLPAITADTLVLHRRDDVFAGRGHADYLAAHIPGAELVELPGTDHPFFIGDADAVVDAIEEFVTGSRPEPRHDRVLATALFVDIVGSTERAAELGDRRWADLLQSFYLLVRRQLDKFEGREVDTAGDGLFASFVGPARAVACATAIRDGVRALGLQVRAGLHAGEFPVINGKIGGLAVHVAARVAAAAAPGEVLVSRTIRDLTSGSDIRFAEHGEHQLKGVPDVWMLYRAEL